MASSPVHENEINEQTTACNIQPEKINFATDDSQHIIGRKRKISCFEPSAPRKRRFPFATQEQRIFRPHISDVNYIRWEDPFFFSGQCYDTRDILPNPHFEVVTVDIRGYILYHQRTGFFANDGDRPYHHHAYFARSQTFYNRLYYNIYSYKCTELIPNMLDMTNRDPDDLYAFIKKETGVKAEGAYEMAELMTTRLGLNGWFIDDDLYSSWTEYVLPKAIIDRLVIHSCRFIEFDKPEKDGNGGDNYI